MNIIQKLMQPGLSVMAQLTEELAILHPSGKKVMMSLDAIRHEKEISDNGNSISPERVNFYIRTTEAEIIMDASFTAQGALWVVEMTETTPVGTSGIARLVKR